MKRWMLATSRLPLLLATFVLCLATLPEIARSATGAETLETVCLQCHGGQEGPLGAPVPLWRQSIHAKNGISCHSCHGGDPADFDMAMSPERGFIGAPATAGVADFCGRCHVGVREDYLASAHGRAEERGPQCVTCHGAHDVQGATLELINAQDCSRCHDYGRADQIKEAVAGIDGRIMTTEREIVALHRIGFATRALQEELFSLRNDFHRIFHSVDVNKVRSETAGFGQRLDLLDTELAALRQQVQWRKLVGSGVVLLLVSIGVLLLLVRRTYAEEEQGRGEE